MSEDVKQSAESSPTEQPGAPPSEQAVREYLKSGKFPDPPKEAAEKAEPEAEPTEESKEPPAGEPEAESAPPKHKGREAEKRIRQLVREKKELAERLDRIEQKVKQVEAPPAPKSETPKAPQKPRLAEFETVEQYEDALDAYNRHTAEQLAREIAKKSIEEYEAKQAKRKAEEEQKTVADSWWNRVKEAKPPEDYAEVTADLPTLLTEEMATVILDSEKGPHIAYHLGNNPEEIERLKALPPVKMVRELLSLEQKLTPWTKGVVAKQRTAITPGVEVVELSGGGSAADPIAAAIKANDFATYARLKNEAERAKRR